MRRISLLAPIGLAALLFLTPLHRIIHPEIDSPLPHAALDAVTVAVLTAPLWTFAHWGTRRRVQLGALIGIVQLPAAVVALSPVGDFALRLAAMVFALGLTWVALGYTRLTATRPPRAARAAVPARSRPLGQARPATR
jgi:hypothetical protein